MRKRKKKGQRRDGFVRVGPFFLRKRLRFAPVRIALVAARSPRGLGGVEAVLERGGKRALRGERRSSKRCMGGDRGGEDDDDDRSLDWIM